VRASFLAEAAAATKLPLRAPLRQLARFTVACCGRWRCAHCVAVRGVACLPVLLWPLPGRGVEPLAVSVGTSTVGSAVSCRCRRHWCSWRRSRTSERPGGTGREPLAALRRAGRAEELRLSGRALRVVRAGRASDRQWCGRAGRLAVARVGCRTAEVGPCRRGLSRPQQACARRESGARVPQAAFTVRPGRPARASRGQAAGSGASWMGAG
jgi:hypothetical protein